MPNRRIEPARRSSRATMVPTARRSFVALGGKSGVERYMPRPEMSGISPFFIVQDAAAALSFYRDRLGFEITF